jgi:DNA polymerase I
VTKPLYLIDASIYIFQAHFSPHTQIWSRRSEDRSAFAGFSRFLLRFLQLARAQRIAVAFDESLFSGFRHRLYADYKSNRVLPDDNLACQLAACATLCKVLGISAFGSREYEADDIIGTLSARAGRAMQSGDLFPPGHGDSVIVSRDKDLSQLLIRDNDSLWDFHGGIRRHRQDIYAQYGIWPEQFPCFLGLTGDSIDCIPGVPGIGPVAARHLLTKFNSLAGIIEHRREIAALEFRGAARCAALIEEHAQQALLSRDLARIVDCDDSAEPFAVVAMEDLQRRPCDLPEFEALMRDMDLEDGEIQRLKTMLNALQRRDAE